MTSTTAPRSRKTLETIAQGCAREAVAALTAVMNDETAPPAARISAANTLLLWGFGKPGTTAREEAERTEQIVRLYWGPAPE